jgi:hypothetical protein
MKKIQLLFILLLFANVLSAQREEYTWDYITFEEPYEFLSVDTTENNIWVIGEANTAWLYAFAGSNAIFTGNSGSYPPNNKSSFTLVLSGANIDHYPYSVYIEFQHRMDTDDGRDGGYIEVSHDGGESWTNLIEDRVSCINPGEWPEHKIYSEEDTLYNGEAGFSGSKDWESVLFGWEECLVKDGNLQGDSLLLKFVFISDDHETNQHGWIIDHIRLFSMQLLGEVQEDIASKLRVFPNPAKDYISIAGSLSEDIQRLEVYDAWGRRMPVIIESHGLSVSAYPVGVYFIRIESGHTIIHRKILVE